ncbi:hypothetical protein CPB86DRAFT_90375 [Serendipita vermifera]|nr:hypothetical protein CPB86DRAFT_90375 [Serendipita vermifera]
MNYSTLPFTTYTSRLSQNVPPALFSDESGDENSSESHPLLQTFTMSSCSSGADALGLMSGSSSVSTSATNTTLSTPSSGPTRDVSEQGITEANVQEYPTEELTPRIGMEDIDTLTDSLKHLLHRSVEPTKSQEEGGVHRRHTRRGSNSRMKRIESGDQMASFDLGVRKSRWERMDAFLPDSKQFHRRPPSCYHSRDSRRKRPSLLMPAQVDSDERGALLDGDTPTNPPVRCHLSTYVPSIYGENGLETAPQMDEQNAISQGQLPGGEALPNVPILKMHQPSAPSSPSVRPMIPSAYSPTLLSPDCPAQLPKAPMIRPSVPQMDRSPSPLSLPSPQILVPNPSELTACLLASPCLD